MFLSGLFGLLKNTLNSSVHFNENKKMPCFVLHV